ncbi:butyrophilin subfamily 2 member A1-like [Chanos chanos]|uniref:Butyrophilin subfamily 2 member A1-like n=1 Tax=Chanos chanos TaxID=29144 RepID=A0A6J2WHD5_CHACN|nr:butyrophilin subfamily 2 member A1-like [Chanos chanos]
MGSSTPASPTMIRISGLEIPNAFSVLVPDSSISAKLGASVVLRCGVSPSLSAVELEVRWYRPAKFNTPILFYSEQKFQDTSVDLDYRGRVSLIGRLEEGNVSLRLENITLSDRGQYECYVSNGTRHDNGMTSLTVNVLGSVPVLSFTETEEEQVNVTCVSDGWSPQPTVTWRDRDGKEIKHSINVMYEKDIQDVVSVSSWLLFSPSESEWISCSVSLSDQEKRESRMLPVRGKTSFSSPTGSEPSWRAFIVMLVISLLTFSVICILLFILYKKRDQNNQEDTEPAGIICPEIGLTSSEDHSSPDEWIVIEETEAEAVKITLDPEEIPNTLKQNRNSIHCHNPNNASPDEKREETRTFALCKEQLSTGKHYWEVKVWKKSKAKLSWYVGVACDNAERFYSVPLTPENGFWVLSYEEEQGVYINADPITQIQYRCPRCGNHSTSGRKVLEQVVTTAWFMVKGFPVIKVTHTMWYIRKAYGTRMDPSHSSHELYASLLPGSRLSSIWAKAIRFKNTYFPQAVQNT